MSMYTDYKTDEKNKKKGIYFESDSFRVKVARAGGKNNKYFKVLEAKTRPYRRAIKADNLPESKGKEIVYESFAEAIVLDWEVKTDDGKWKKGIEGEDGKILPVNKKNIVDTFIKLPDLFADIKEVAEKASLYREEVLEEESKN